MARKEYVFDIEANGLYETATQIWCIVIKDIRTAETRSFSMDEIEEAVRELSEADTLIGHNIINYDLPTLKKLHDWEPKPGSEIVDTLVMSRLFNPDRGRPANYPGKGGPHSLEAWGYRVGRGKVAHEDWSVFSPAMLRRCSEDVEINHLVYLSLQAEVKGHNWSEALELEQQVAAIITQQEIDGVLFDLPKAKELIDDLTKRIDDIEAELLPGLPSILKPYGNAVSKPFKVSGEYTQQVLRWYPSLEDSSDRFVGGPFTRLNWEPFNLGSQPQVKEYLLSQGWQPTEWNYVQGSRTSPKLTEDSFGTIKGEMGQLIKRRTLYNHRRAQIQGWVERCRGDGRLAAGANPCGTNTGRMRHHNVVNVPKAADHVVYGKEMRSLFIAPDDRVLVGHDASGLELRMLAHYMNDPEYTDLILHGDIHEHNQRLAGLPNRDDAKTFIYAFLYGAGNEKIGSIVGGSEAEGAALKRDFLRGLPSLARLLQNVKRASKKGYLRGLDGRRIWMRRKDGEVMSHKSLNTLLQSAGAVVMKKSMVILNESVSRHSLDAIKVVDMHDEAQAEVAPQDVKKYCELAEQSIVLAGEHFKLNIPLDAEAKTGRNWAETH